MKENTYLVESQRALDKMKSLKETREQALHKVPSFSEYNVTEQAARKKKLVDKINDDFFLEVEVLLNNLQKRIKTLTQDAFRKRYPLLSDSNVLDSARALRGAVEYNTAIAIIQGLKEAYPSDDLLLQLTQQGRTDLSSALLDLGKQKQNDPNTTVNLVEQSADRNRFLSRKNSLDKANGSWDDFREIVELENAHNKIFTDPDVVGSRLTLSPETGQAPFSTKELMDGIQRGVALKTYEANYQQKILELNA